MRNVNRSMLRIPAPTIRAAAIATLLTLAGLEHSSGRVAAQEKTLVPRTPPVVVTPTTENVAGVLTPAEKEFQETMTGAVLAGAFSVDGKKGTPKEERYEISEVKKLAPGKVDSHVWIITSRIKYGDKDIKLPVPVEVRWAGDTPMIQLTETTIPLMGTFTARVMIYKDRYAGTWQHDAVGGHMWGKLEKKAVAPTSEAPSK